MTERRQTSRKFLPRYLQSQARLLLISIWLKQISYFSGCGNTELFLWCSDCKGRPHRAAFHSPAVSPHVFAAGHLLPDVPRPCCVCGAAVCSRGLLCSRRPALPPGPSHCRAHALCCRGCSTAGETTGVWTCQPASATTAGQLWPTYMKRACVACTALHHIATAASVFILSRFHSARVAHCIQIVNDPEPSAKALISKSWLTRGRLTQRSSCLRDSCTHLDCRRWHQKRRSRSPAWATIGWVPHSGRNWQCSAGEL